MAYYFAFNDPNRLINAFLSLWQEKECFHEGGGLRESENQTKTAPPQNIHSPPAHIYICHTHAYLYGACAIAYWVVCGLSYTL